MFQNFQNININKTNKIDKVMYINLDHRTDRRREIEEELSNYGIPFERFSAINDTDYGALGCAKSHLEILKIAKSHGYANILILEDDFQFIVSKESFYKSISDLLYNNINFDVCLLSYNIKSPKFIAYSNYDFLYKVKSSLCASGYLVNYHYYDTLIECFQKSVDLIESTKNTRLYACDMVWQQYQYKGNWFCFKNRIGIQRVSYSDIEKIVVEYKV